jgi:hypothetical protein
MQNRKLHNKEEMQIITVDDFDKKYFPDCFKLKQKELDYQESETIKESKLLQMFAVAMK